MEKKHLSIWLLSFCFILILLTLPLLGACTKPAPDTPTTPAPATTPSPSSTPASTPEVFEFGYTASLPIVGKTMWFCEAFCEMVTERSDGELTITLRGGPEVISAKMQPEALKTGVLEVGALATSTRIEPYVPEVAPWPLTKVGNAELRKRGYVEWMTELIKEKANMMYLGECFITDFTLMTTKEVTTPQDLAGQRLGVGALWIPFCEALEATPIPVEVPDLGNAVQRGLIDGFFQGQPNVLGMHQYEMVKYWIDQPYYNYSAAYGHLVNLDAWNKLPEHLQDIMMEVALEIEEQAITVQEELYEEASKVFVDSGVERVTFSPDDAELYLDLAYESRWNDIKPNLSAESYDKLREILAP